MAVTGQEPKTPQGRRARSRILLIVVVTAALFACAAVVYFTQQNIRSAERRHEILLGTEVSAAANSITAYLESRQQQVKDFAREQSPLLNELAGNAQSAVLHRQIGNILRLRFPGYFTFTIADRDGTDLIDDLDGFVGDACKLGIREYVEHLAASGNGTANRTADYRTVIHPQANNYHFDVMAPWSDGDVLKGVFFVSFFPTQLRGTLNAHQSPGHALVIINTDRPYLIEVTAAGARDKISLRRDINLTDNEIAQIRATQDIPGSHWRVVGYVEPDLLKRARTDAWFDAAIFLTFVIVAAAGIIGLAPGAGRA